jgi:formyl-CoA transferase
VDRRRALRARVPCPRTTTFYGRQNVVRERGSVRHSGWPGGAFRTNDARFIVFTTPAQHLFERFCAMLGEPDLPKDPRFASHEGRSGNMGMLIAMAETWFAARTFAEAVEGLKRHDIPHSPIMSMADIFADPHYLEQPGGAVGDRPLPQPAVVPRLSLTPGRATRAGPPLGRHTDEVLTSLHSMTPSQIADLRAAGVV